MRKEAIVFAAIPFEIVARGPVSGRAGLHQDFKFPETRWCRAAISLLRLMAHHVFVVFRKEP
jgi:hypothetical protein